MAKNLKVEDTHDGLLLRDDGPDLGVLVEGIPFLELLGLLHQLGLHIVVVLLVDVQPLQADAALPALVEAGEPQPSHGAVQVGDEVLDDARSVAAELQNHLEQRKTAFGSDRFKTFLGADVERTTTHQRVVKCLVDEMVVCPTPILLR